MAVLSFNGSYTQNFDALAISGANLPWANGSTLEGWFLFRQPAPGTALIQYNAGTGSSNAGSFYSFGDFGSTERALGGVGSGGTYYSGGAGLPAPGSGAAAGWIVLGAVNAAGGTINELQLTFDGEQWRNGGVTVAQTMSLEYGFGADFTTVPAWSAAGAAFNWASPVTGGVATGAAVLGNTTGKVADLGGALTGLNWAAGQTLWLRWIEVNDAGNDHGLAIDNVRLSATSVVAPGVAITESGGTTAVAEGGATDSYTVVLRTQPTADVTVAVLPDADATTSASTLVFTPANWNVAQTVTVTAVDDSVFEGPHNATIAHSVTSADAGYNGLTVAVVSATVAENDVPPTARIAEIQGASHHSPLVGTAVGRVPGIVTAVASNGFFMQDPLPDADPATSEGIFVFTSRPPSVALGDAVRVSGVVEEFRPGGNTNNLTVTELVGRSNLQPLVVEAWTDVPQGASVSPLILGVDRVAPVAAINDDPGAGNVETGGDFQPASDGIDFYESLEGMLLQVRNPVAVSPTNSFGEIWVLPEGGAGATGVTARGGIAVSANDFNPERLQLDNLLASQVFPTVDVGARLDSVTGVLDYNFNNFELRTLLTPTVAQDSTLQREMSALTGTRHQLTVATFNVENLDALDPQEKFDALAEAIVNNLRSPDIINLEEVQDNDGSTVSAVVDASATLKRLLTAILAVSPQGGPSYQFLQLDPANGQDGGEPGGNIRVAFLYNPARVTPVAGTLQRLTDTDLSDGDAFDSSRKPLVSDFVFNGDVLTVIGNHFNSKGGDQPLFGPTQPPVLTSEVQRIEQAEIVRDFVAGKLAADPGARVIVAGDLNDFEFSGPLTVLEGGGLSSLVETLPVNERYSYNFEGNAQTLDHILASPALLADLSGYDVVHINSEFAVQVSDHDPVVARFDIPLDQVITGTSTANVLVGGPGDDTITGLQGRDRLTGGGGMDRFVYTSLLDAGDVVTDFVVGEDWLVVGQLLQRVGYFGADPVGARYIGITSVSGRTFVTVDTDGAGPSPARQLVELVGVPASTPVELLLEPVAIPV